MYKNHYIVLIGLLLGCSAIASAENPLIEKITQKVIEKYQNTPCQELAAQKNQPDSAMKEKMEKRFIDMLRDNPEMRKEFINQVAGPIANKLFECGMIP